MTQSSMLYWRLSCASPCKNCMSEILLYKMAVYDGLIFAVFIQNLFLKL